MKKEQQTDAHAHEQSHAQETIKPEVVTEEHTQKNENAQEKQIAELEQQVGDLKQKYAYLYADFDNYRKRVAKDIQTARQEGLIKALEPMINVLDHFRMAVDASHKTDNVEKIREGLLLISEQLKKAVSETGIESIEAQDQTFDPAIHEAISQQPSDKVEGTVLQQWTCGYKLGDRLIRPARVVVSSGPEKA